MINSMFENNKGAIRPRSDQNKSYKQMTDFESLRPINELLGEFRTAKSIRSDSMMIECKKKWILMGLRRFRQPTGAFNTSLWILYNDQTREGILIFLMVL
jgi:hypothetical protein